MRTRGLTIVALTAALCGGCGAQSTSRQTNQAHPAAQNQAHPAAHPAARVSDPSLPVAHPQAVEPTAGAAPRMAAGPVPTSAGVSVSVGRADASLPQPQSLSSIRQELSESGMTANTTQATLTAGGLAVAPIDAPPVVQEVIAAGNEIARLPYIWGGGHMTYEDTGYDCSGSISFVFAAAGLLNHTVTSGELESYGDPGPGKWITIFANAGHTFMYVAGLRFDTVALAQTGSRWSDRSADEPDLSSFVVRHPPGL